MGTVYPYHNPRLQRHFDNEMLFYAPVSNPRIMEKKVVKKLPNTAMALLAMMLRKRCMMRSPLGFGRPCDSARSLFIGPPAPKR